MKSTDKFISFTYQDKLTRSNTQYNTDLIAKLRKQAIKTSKNLYLSGSKCWYGGMMDQKFWYNIEFWCLNYTQNVLKQCIFESTIMFFFVLELPATSNQLWSNSLTNSNVYFKLWFPVVYLCNATIDFDGNFFKGSQMFCCFSSAFFRAIVRCKLPR